MPELTRLDAAHAAMEATPDDASVRMRFYDKLAEAELFLLLSAEAKGDQITPEIFDLSDNSFVLVFDREARLAQFTGCASPYAALTGRTIARMLAPNGLGLGLNLEVAPSSILIPPEAVKWLAQTLESIPAAVEARVEKFHAPKGLPDEFLLSLDAKLAGSEGLAPLAYLVGVTYENGAQGHLLGFVDAQPGAEPALAQAVSEALIFAGLEAATLDVGFFAASDSAAPRLAACGLRFDLPQPLAQPVRSAPGSNPDKPPILR
ncbi:hypothetical protein PEL8287_01110 [Roseovarius litorisediminis]|uniref:SseB protein N-terminal domain-containing protein n=1 Tax=Roseovarius litorisediminis TaxID=1312363 RepID=A0A1Y5RT08_9RHOB|nr:SseB family protein [Roseovarius litorisediminis]SLN24341.1 hypothetical protein PEL8287_01110 [Roseovarius litorisediminis]